ncbi:MAG: T9SS type A sorting domain-containing protein [Flavobacterium sp.]|nr:T9SS type A sorting domain-containing protein [Flavobacterium sp.]
MISKRLKNQFKSWAAAALFLLSAPLAAQNGNVTIGESSVTTTGNSAISPLYPNTKFVRYQTVYTKAEIQAAGGAAGLITSLGWRVAAATSFYNNYTIRMGHTSATSSSSHNFSPTTQVYSMASINFAAGYHMLPLSTAFTWNGNDNILIDICYSRTSANSGSNAGSVYNFSATNPALRYRNSTGTTTLCATDTQYTGFGLKPVIRFVMPLATLTCEQPSTLNAGSVTASDAILSWTAPLPIPAMGYETFLSTTATPPSSGISTTSLSQSVSGLVAATTYFYGVRSRCSTGSFSDWTVSEFTTLCIAPQITSANATAVCGSGTSVLSASATSGTIYWYDAATGGNLLGSGNNFLTPTLISTQSYYAAAGTPTGSTANVSIGEGSLTSTNFTASSTPFYVYGSQKNQYIIRASELTAAGLSAGQISSLSMEVVSVGNPSLSAFSISAGSTASNIATTSFISGLTTVYSTASQPITVGTNTYNFSQPLYWNGTSNIVLQICWNNGNAGTAVNSVKYDNTAFTSQTYFYTVSSASSVSCTASTGLSTANSRPKFILKGSGLCMASTRTEVTAVVATATAYFADVDGDGFGAGQPIMLCEETIGYVVTNSDCDDDDAEIYPGAEEIPNNGIDENCNGMDDDFQIDPVFTQIKAVHCGSTLTDLYSPISADAVAGASAYRFIVTNTATNVVQTVVRNVAWFSFTNLQSFAYGTTYSIAVEVQMEGHWIGESGESCLVSTPELVGNYAPGISQCGITITDFYAPLTANSFPGITAYRFRVSNLSNPAATNAVQVLTRNVNWFSFTNLSGYDYGASYSVEVSVMVAGEFSEYGNACTVFTPALAGGFNPEIRQCGVTFSDYYAPIIARSYPGVTGYRFKVTNLTTQSVQVITRTANWISFNNVADLQSGTAYNIEVALLINGAYSAYGTSCTVYTAGVAIVYNGAVTTADFKVVASPNPYTDAFGIDVATNVTSLIEVRVFDMIGKLLEIRSVQPGDIASQRLGSNFPSGVYNVIITQGEVVKALKVVKR